MLSSVRVEIVVVGMLSFPNMFLLKILVLTTDAPQVLGSRIIIKRAATILRMADRLTSCKLQSYRKTARIKNATLVTMQIWRAEECLSIGSFKNYTPPKASCISDGQFIHPGSNWLFKASCAREEKT